MSKFQQGIYKPKYPEKYKGNPDNIIYRSSWELSVLRKLDLHPDIIQYSSEEVVIPYISPLDNRRHRYFVDFYVKARSANGQITESLLEVKPYNQTQQPQSKNGKKTKTFVHQVTTYAVNQAKWKAAQEYCKARGWEWQLITEKDLAGFS